MAMGDFDTGSNIIGRIELVEEITLGLREIAPKHFEFTLEETHYAEWLSKAFNPELVTFFFYGVT